MAATSVPTDELEITGSTLRWWDTPGEAAYGFCAQCGSTVLWRAEGSDRTSIAAGTLDVPTGLWTEGMIFGHDASDYHQLDPSIPHLDLE